MKTLCFILCMLVTAPVYAGEPWKVDKPQKVYHQRAPDKPQKSEMFKHRESDHYHRGCMEKIAVPSKMHWMSGSAFRKIDL